MVDAFIRLLRRKIERPDLPKLIHTRAATDIAWGRSPDAIRASRLLSRTTALLVVMFAVAGVAVYLPMRASFLHAFDAALLLEASALASQVERTGDEIVLEFDLAELPEYSRSDRPHYFQIWSADGHPVAKSRSLTNRNLPMPVNLSEAADYQAATLPGVARARQVSLRFQPARGSRRSHPLAGVGRPFDDNRGPRHGRTRRDAGHLGLAPVGGDGADRGPNRIPARSARGTGITAPQRLGRGNCEVGVADLAERLQIAEAPTELVPVVQRLNELLARLEDTLTRKSRSPPTWPTSCARRSPGCAPRWTYASSGHDRPRSINKSLANACAVAESIQAMVSNLLVLARADAQQLVVETEAVEVDQLLHACWSPFASTAQGRNLNVQWDVSDSAIVQLDRDKASLVFKNLFENAVNYAADAGWIRITARNAPRETR